MMICLTNSNVSVNEIPEVRRFIRDLPFNINVNGSGENEVELCSTDYKKKITINFYKGTMKIEEDK